MRLDKYTVFHINAAIMVPEIISIFSNDDHWRAVFSPLGTAPGFRWSTQGCFKKASGLWKMSSTWNLPPSVYMSFRLLLILPARLVMPKIRS